MLKIPNELLDVYVEELAIAEYSFEMMGKLLDQDELKRSFDFLRSV